MKKINTITALAEALGKKINVKAWEKNGKSRLYFNGLGYHTKKMETKAWIELGDHGATTVVRIDCPSQTNAWIHSQQEELKERMQKYVRYINRFYDFGTTSTPVEVIMNNALLEAEEVKGYYTEWRNVQVPINRFGKLAIRNRQFVVPFEGTKNTAPRTFIPLSDKAFDFLKEKGTAMLDAYQEVPDYEAMVAYRDQFLADEKARKEEDEHRKALEAAQLLINQETLRAKIAAGDNVLLAWKEAGSPHPVPAQVMEAKAASGLNWKKFIETIL